MAYDQLKIYNNALMSYLGEAQLEDLDEARGPRYLLDQVWAEDSIKYCLEQGQWRHAIRTIKLEADTGIEPEFGHRYAFAQPDDMLRLAGISSNEFFNEPFTQFVDEAGYWYADIDIIYVQIISNGDDYGRNYSRWSPAFFEFVSCYHAWKIVSRVKNASSSRKELGDELENMRKNASGKDASNRPTRFPSRGSWAHSRHGRNSSLNRERR